MNVSASTSDVSSATAIVSASDRKKTPVMPVSSASGRKTTTGVIVEPMIGPVISLMRVLHGFARAIRRATMCV